MIYPKPTTQPTTMNNKEQQPEPLAAILAEMRDGIHTGRADIIDCVNDVLARYADRIEAAAERERAITDAMLAVKDKPIPHPDPEHAPPIYPGNGAEIRAALEYVLRHVTVGWAYPDVRKLICDALAAPPRNCDRFQTAEEAVAAFADHLREWENAHGICSEHPDHPVKVPAGAFAWFFAQAEEGGGHA